MVLIIGKDEVGGSNSLGIFMDVFDVQRTLEDSRVLSLMMHMI